MTKIKETPDAQAPIKQNPDAQAHAAKIHADKISTARPTLSKIALKEHYKKHFGIPHIGMRIVKTALAVALCFAIDRWHGGLPTNSAIAAIICMQGTNQETLESGLHRLIGTLLGGIFGGLTLWFFQSCQISWTSPLFYTSIALLIIPVIYITVLLGRKQSVALTCIVFLIIAFNHGKDVNPLRLAVVNTLSNSSGIIIAWLVNLTLPGYKKKTSLALQESLHLKRKMAQATPLKDEEENKE